MQSAKSLYLGGKTVSAREALEGTVAALRPVCPRCGELVHLVRRSGNPYFAHWPRTSESPPCEKRAASSSGGGGGASASRDERRRESEAFRRTLLAAHNLAEPVSPPQEPSGLLRRIAGCLQRSWRLDEELVPANAEAIVRSSLGGDSGAAPPTDPRVQAVLALWSHLHLPQTEDDLLFLLRVGEALVARGALRTDTEGPPRLDEAVLAPALEALAGAPWADQAGTTGAQRPRPEDDSRWTNTCSQCGLTPAESEAGVPLGPCTVCGDSACGDCRHECSGCDAMVCDSCGPECPGCDERVCENCGFECRGCGEITCSDCTQACEKCGRLYCPGCADENLCTCIDCYAVVCADCSVSIPFQGERVCRPIKGKLSGEHRRVF